jgi:saccharopine dehydrogenase-like NADP-dependent oxidoreductase
MGMDPGAVNVFARWAVDRPDTATSIRVQDADNGEVKGYRFAVLFSPETFFEESAPCLTSSRMGGSPRASRRKPRSRVFEFPSRSVT